MRFEMTKLRLRAFSAQLDTWKYERQSITIDKAKCCAAANEFAAKYARADIRLCEVIPQRNRSRLENWIWRGVAAAWLYFTFK